MKWVGVAGSVIVVAALIFGLIRISANRAGTPSGSSQSVLEGLTTEVWSKDPGQIRAATTATSTILADKKTIRMYLLAGGGISWMESSDGKTFAQQSATGITSDETHFVSNPSVAKLRASTFLMAYATKESTANDPTKAVSSIYLARSSDGKSFSKGEVLIDGRKEDNNLATAPNLVVMPNGTLRLYFVSGRDGIVLLEGADGAASWKRTFLNGLPTGATGPDVVYQNGSWTMYLTTQPSQIDRATSTDGIKWNVVQTGLINPSNPNGFVSDPDVLTGPNDTQLMYFGEGDDRTQITSQNVILRSAIRLN